MKKPILFSVIAENGRIYPIRDIAKELWTLQQLNESGFPNLPLGINYKPISCKAQLLRTSERYLVYRVSNGRHVKPSTRYANTHTNSHNPAMD